MAQLTIDDGRVAVRFTRTEKVLGLVRDHDFPLTAVTSTHEATDGLSAARGVRAPGLGLPGWRKVGTWRGRARSLVSVRRGQPALVLELSGQRFARLVIGTDDPSTTLARLRAEA